MNTFVSLTNICDVGAADLGTSSQPRDAVCRHDGPKHGQRQTGLVRKSFLLCRNWASKTRLTEGQHRTREIRVSGSSLGNQEGNSQHPAVPTRLGLQFAANAAGVRQFALGLGLQVARIGLGLHSSPPQPESVSSPSVSNSSSPPTQPESVSSP